MLEKYITTQILKLCLSDTCSDGNSEDQCQHFALKFCWRTYKQIAPFQTMLYMKSN